MSYYIGLLLPARVHAVHNQCHSGADGGQLPGEVTNNDDAVK